MLGRLIVLVITAGVGLAAVSALGAIMAIGETMYPEGWLLYSILRVRDGHDLYTDYRSSPFILALYTPLYYWSVAAGSRVARLNPAETLVFARSVSLAAMALAGFVVYRVGRHAGLDRGAALGAGGLFLSSYALYPWAYATRPDALALALALAGVAVGLSSLQRRGAVLAAALLAAAFFTKQSYIVGIAALTLAALQGRQWGRATLLAATWGACLGAGIAWLEWSTGGLFSRNAFAPNAVSMDLGLAYGRLSVFVQLSVPLLVLAALGWRSTRIPAGPRRVLTWYAALAGGLAVVALAKVGSNYNYLLELVAVLAVFGGHGLAGLLSTAPPTSVPSAHGAFHLWRGALALIGLTCVTASFVLPMQTLVEHGTRRADTTSLIEAIAQVPGPVLSQHDSLAVLLAGKTPILADPLGLALLVPDGRWDPTPVAEMVATHQFSLIVLDSPASVPLGYDGVEWWPSGIREQIEREYRLVRRLGAHYLYAPTGFDTAEAGS